jgi:hypothetical protein
MAYKPGDVVAWEGGNGILNCGREYYVDLVRKGMRVQEFTLKYKNGRKVGNPAVWWEAGEPFVKHRKAVKK